MSKKAEKITESIEYVYCLKSVNADMTAAHQGFVWPKEGPVTCPDWKPTKACGNGLHGLLWGEGNAGLLNMNQDANWLVLKVDASQIIDLDGKVKFPECEVVFCGERQAAVEYLQALAPAGKCIHFSTATAGARWYGDGWCTLVRRRLVTMGASSFSTTTKPPIVIAIKSVTLARMA